MTAHLRRRDVLDVLREANPAPLEAGGLDSRARTDLDRILIGDLTPRLDPTVDLDGDLSPGSRQRSVRSARSSDGATVQGAVLPLWRRRRPRVMAAVTAVAAVGVIAVVGLGTPGHAPVAAADTPPALVMHPAAANTDAAVTLNHLADLAAAQPAPAPAAFEYLESIDYGTVTSFYRRDGKDVTAVQVAPSRTRMWVSPTTGAARWTSVSAGGTDAWSSDGIIDPALIDPAGETTNEATIGPADSSVALPTDVDALKATLDAGGHTPDGGLVRGYLDDLYNRFSKTLPSPAQQATIWRLLAGIGQMKTLGTTTDRAGRPAIAISYDTTGTMAGQKRYQLLIDPTTGLLLGHEEIALTTSAMWPQQAPAVMGAATYLLTAGVDSDTTVSSGDQR